MKKDGRAARIGGNARDPARRGPVRGGHGQDLAFQKAMMRAIASGRERPPMIGIFKDPRPLNAPQLFEPVPHTSGCTSPALVCAELIAEIDPVGTP
jgi:hypothetical protein